MINLKIEVILVKKHEAKIVRSLFQIEEILVKKHEAKMVFSL